MTGEELAKLCFAARPLLWAVAIIAVLLVAFFTLPKILGKNEEDDASSTT